jgi:hypothetical protein
MMWRHYDINRTVSQELAPIAGISTAVVTMQLHINIYKASAPPANFLSLVNSPALPAQSRQASS